MSAASSLTLNYSAIIILPCVESFDSAFSHNLPRYGEWARGAARLAAELDAHLDHIHGLDLAK